MIAVYCPSSLSSIPLSFPSSSAVDQLASQGQFSQPQPSPRPSPKSEHCMYDAINQVPSVARERSDSEVSFSGPLVYPTKPTKPSPLRLNTSVDDAINTDGNFKLPPIPPLPPTVSTAASASSVDGLYKTQAPYIMTEYEPCYASNASNISMASGSSPSVGQKRKIMNTSLIHQVTSGATSSTQSFFHSSTSSSSLNKPPAAAPVALKTGVLLLSFF